MRVRNALRVITWAALLLLAAAALVVGSQRHGPPPSLAERVNAIAVGVRCPVCGGQNVADSNTYAAQAIKTDITRRLRSGETPTQIRAYLVSRYGTRILESPPASGIDGLVWWVPAVAIPAAAVGLLVALRRSRPAPTSSPSAEDCALVDAALRSPAPGTHPGVAETLSLDEEPFEVGPESYPEAADETGRDGSGAHAPEEMASSPVRQSASPPTRRRAMTGSHSTGHRAVRRAGMQRR